MAVQLAAQPDQPGTFGGNGTPGAGQGRHRGAQPDVGGQLVGVRLGQSGADDQSPHVGGQRLVAQRIDRYHLGSGRGEQIGGLGVPVTGRHGDGRPGGRADQVAGAGAVGHGLGG